MKKIEVVCPKLKLEELKKVIYEFDIGGFLITNLTGVGFHRGAEKHRGLKYVEMPKIKVEAVIKDADVDVIIAELLKVLQTGKIGDGKIFIYPADNVIRVRTGEKEAI
ncbi:MAG: P-II family nitrogen regulator [Elusimicrobiota bacterium]